MLADVDAGSDTPSLVSKVLSWREAKKEESDNLWATLHAQNQALAATLLRMKGLGDSDPENYAAAVKYLSSLQPVQVSHFFLVYFF